MIEISRTQSVAARLAGAVAASSVHTPAITLLPDGRMSAKDAAAYVGLSEKTLAIKRCNGTGPKYVKRGRIFYYQEDLDRWLGESRQTSTAQTRHAAAAERICELRTASRRRNTTD